MFKKLFGILGLGLLMTIPVSAQTLAPPVVPGYLTTKNCPSGLTVCFVQSGSGQSVAGTQVGLVITSATALTVPTGATAALIQAQGGNNGSGICLFWRDDGTNPTGTAGQEMATLGSMYYKVGTLPIKLIAATGSTCTATVSYYQ